MDVILVALGCLAACGVVGFLAYQPVRRAAIAHAERPHPLQDRRALLVGAGVAACIVGCLLIAVDTSRPGGLMGSLGIVAQLVPMGVSVVLGGCLAMLAWQPDWVAVELRRLALALTVTAAIVAVAGAASTTWLLAMLLAVAVFAGLAHVLRRRPVGDRVAA